MHIPSGTYIYPDVALGPGRPHLAGTPTRCTAPVAIERVLRPAEFRKVKDERGDRMEPHGWWVQCLIKGRRWFTVLENITL